MTQTGPRQSAASRPTALQNRPSSRPADDSPRLLSSKAAGKAEPTNRQHSSKQSGKKNTKQKPLQHNPPEDPIGPDRTRNKECGGSLTAARSPPPARNTTVIQRLQHAPH